MDARAAAFESMRQAHHMLPAQYHGLSVEVLGTGCLALPRAQRPGDAAYLTGVLERIRRLRARDTPTCSRPPAGTTRARPTELRFGIRSFLLRFTFATGRADSGTPWHFLELQEACDIT